MHEALDAILAQSPPPHRGRIERAIGRLQASLAYTPVAELLTGDLHAFLNGVLDQCRGLHAAVHEAYIDYPIEAAFHS
jgi:uncharacterized alpha-E superfamily protein